MTPPPPLEKFQTEADCFFRWLPLSWSYSYGYGYGYGYSFITFINWIMSVPWLESGSTGKYQHSVSGVPSGCALGNSLDLMLVFPCTPLLSSMYRLSTVQNRGRSAVHYIAVHCKSAICYTVKFNAVQEIELLCIETIYIFKTFQWSALHIKEVQCNSMDSNIDQCSAVECTAAQPRLTKSPCLHCLRYLVSPVCGIFFYKSRAIMLYKFL